MYSIYKDGRLIGSSNDIEYVIEFTKLMIDRTTGDTKKNSSSRLKQLYEDRLTVNSPKVGINQLQHILEHVGYKLEVDI